MRLVLDALRSTGRLRLLVGLWAIAAGCAALFAAPLGAELGALLDARPAAEALVRGDDGLALELARLHGATLGPTMRGGVVGGGALYLLLSWVAAGAVLAFVAHRRRPAGTAGAAAVGPTADRPGVLAETGRAAAALVRVGLVGLLLDGAALAVGGGLGYLVTRLAGHRGFGALAGALAAGGLATLLLLGAARTVTHIARALVFSAPGPTSAFRAVGRALRRAFRHRRGALPLVLLTALGWLVPTAAYLAIAPRLDAWPTGSFVLLLALRHLTVIARLWADAAALAGAAALVDTPPAPQRGGR